MPFKAPPLKKNNRFDSLKSSETNPFKKSRRNNQNRTTNSRANKNAPSRFVSKYKPKPTFDLKTASFPELSQSNATQNNKNTLSYEHIKNPEIVPCTKVEESNLEPGWIRYVKQNGSWYVEEFITESDEPISQDNIIPNTTIADRYEKYCNDMNNLLGDISPYWCTSLSDLESDSESDYESDLESNFD